MSMQTSSDAEAFYQFLGGQISAAAAAKSPEELLQEWRELREFEQTLAAVEEGVRDMNAGRMHKVRDLLDEASKTSAR